MSSSEEEDPPTESSEAASSSEDEEESSESEQSSSAEEPSESEEEQSEGSASSGAASDLTPAQKSIARKPAIGRRKKASDDSSSEELQEESEDEASEEEEEASEESASVEESEEDEVSEESASVEASEEDEVSEEDEASVEASEEESAEEASEEESASEEATVSEEAEGSEEEDEQDSGSEEVEASDEEVESEEEASEEEATVSEDAEEDSDEEQEEASGSEAEDEASGSEVEDEEEVSVSEEEQASGSEVEVSEEGSASEEEDSENEEASEEGSASEQASEEGEEVSGDEASGDEASGDEASGDEASGDEASGDEASGDEASEQEEEVSDEEEVVEESEGEPSEEQDEPEDEENSEREDDSQGDEVADDASDQTSVSDTVMTEQVSPGQGSRPSVSADAASIESGNQTSVSDTVATEISKSPTRSKASTLEAVSEDGNESGNETSISDTVATDPTRAVESRAARAAATDRYESGNETSVSDTVATEPTKSPKGRSVPVSESIPEPVTFETESGNETSVSETVATPVSPRKEAPVADTGKPNPIEPSMSLGAKLSRDEQRQHALDSIDTNSLDDISEMTEDTTVKRISRMPPNRTPSNLASIEETDEATMGQSQNLSQALDSPPDMLDRNGKAQGFSDVSPEMQQGSFGFDSEFSPQSGEVGKEHGFVADQVDADVHQSFEQEAQTQHQDDAFATQKQTSFSLQFPEQAETAPPAPRSADNTPADDVPPAPSLTRGQSRGRKLFGRIFSSFRTKSALNSQPQAATSPNEANDQPGAAQKPPPEPQARRSLSPMRSMRNAFNRSGPIDAGDAPPPDRRQRFGFRSRSKSKEGSYADMVSDGSELALSQRSYSAEVNGIQPSSDGFAPQFTESILTNSKTQDQERHEESFVLNYNDKLNDGPGSKGGFSNSDVSRNAESVQYASENELVDTFGGDFSSQQLNHGSDPQNTAVSRRGYQSEESRSVATSFCGSDGESYVSDRDGMDRSRFTDSGMSGASYARSVASQGMRSVGTQSVASRSVATQSIASRSIASQSFASRASTATRTVASQTDFAEEEEEDLVEDRVEFQERELPVSYDTDSSDKEVIAFKFGKGKTRPTRREQVVPQRTPSLSSHISAQSRGSVDKSRSVGENSGSRTSSSSASKRGPIRGLAARARRRFSGNADSNVDVYQHEPQYTTTLPGDAEENLAYEVEEIAEENDAVGGFPSEDDDSSFGYEGSVISDALFSRDQKVIHDSYTYSKTDLDHYSKESLGFDSYSESGAHAQQQVRRASRNSHAEWSQASSNYPNPAEDGSVGTTNVPIMETDGSIGQEPGGSGGKWNFWAKKGRDPPEDEYTQQAHSEVLQQATPNMQTVHSRRENSTRSRPQLKRVNSRDSADSGYDLELGDPQQAGRFNRQRPPRTTPRAARRPKGSKTRKGSTRLTAKKAEPLSSRPPESDISLATSRDGQFSTEFSADVECARPKDEYSLSSKISEPEKMTKSKQCGWIIVLILLALTGIAAGIGVGAYLRNRSNGTNRSPTPLAAASETGDSPTASPIQGQDTFQIVCNQLDDCSAMKDEGTPQGKAFAWLLDSDFNPNIESMPNTKIIDRYALATLYYSLEGESWVENDGWLSNADECQWFSTARRSCNESEDALVTLELDSNNLQGELPSEIGLLTTLTEVKIQNPHGDPPHIRGSLPTTIGKLTMLRSLTISGNEFESGIPRELGSLSGLQTLDLRSNKLHGDIPLGFEGMTSLTYLNLSDNSLTGGVPSELLDSARDLLEIHLADNFFTSLPDSIKSLRNVQVLNLADNELVVFPEAVTSLGTLQVLNLNGNQFGDRMPTQFGGLVSLRELYLSRNDFSAAIPVSLGTLARLQILDLSFNRLTSTIPFQLGQLIKLENLFLNGNRLTGEIPQELTRLSRMSRVRFDNNNLSGDAPTLLCDLYNVNEVVSYADCAEITGGGDCFTFCCIGSKCQCRFESTDFLRCIPK